MSLTTEQIKQFVETQYKDNTILITCDNEHRFYHRLKNYPDIVWDWENEYFTALETNEAYVSQKRQPMQITRVSFGEIQFLTAYLDTVETINFINDNYTDKSKDKAIAVLNRMAPCMGTPESLSDLTSNSRSPYPNTNK